MKYEVLESSYRTKLERMVNELILDGYVPKGGVSVCESGMSTYYYQAMIKHDEVKMNLQDDISRDLLSLMTIASRYK